MVWKETKPASLEGVWHTGRTGLTSPPDLSGQAASSSSPTNHVPLQGLPPGQIALNFLSIQRVWDTLSYLPVSLLQPCQRHLSQPYKEKAELQGEADKKTKIRRRGQKKNTEGGVRLEEGERPNAFLHSTKSGRTRGRSAYKGKLGKVYSKQNFTSVS